MTIVILTPIEVEYRAVRKFLENRQSQLLHQSSYETGTYQGSQVIIRQIGATNNVAATETIQMLHHFQPDYVIMVGVAGGVKDVSIGDVLVPTKVYAYERGKDTDSGFVTRPDTYRFDQGLIERAKMVDREFEDLSVAPPYKVFFGPVASGDKVINSHKAQITSLIKGTYNDTLGLEMEAVGFATALMSSPSTKGIMIRGVSDLLDDKSKADESGSQERASANAAHFAFSLIKKLQTTPESSMKEQKAKEIMIEKVQLPLDEVGQATEKKELMVLKNKIAKNNVKEVIDELLKITEASPEIYNEVATISTKWEGLQRKSRIGLLSTEEETRLSNQITFSLLNIIDSIE